MANPQLENGHTRISNELLEALATAHLNPSDWQVLLVILRQTYGFQRKQAVLSNGFIAKATGLDRSNVIRALRRLVAGGVVSQATLGGAKTLGIVKDYESWKLVSRTTPSVSYDTKGSVSYDTPPSVSYDTQKRKDLKKRAKKKPMSIPAAQIIAHLNHVAGRRFQANGSNQKQIEARWREGYRTLDFFLIHWHKAESWLTDAKMSEYMRPSTLYRPSHFSEYLEAAERWAVESESPRPFEKDIFS